MTRFRSVSAAFVPIVAALALVTGAATAVAQGSAAHRFGAIVVDTSELAAQSSPEFADRVKEAMEIEAQKVFGAEIAPGDRAAPTLVIHISSVDLALNVVPTGQTRHGAGDNDDSMEGAGLIVGPRRTLESSTPMFAQLRSDYATSWQVDPLVSDSHRVHAISYAFAFWLKQRMAL